MRSLKSAFPAIALIVALIGVAAVPVYAGQERPGCAPAAKAHGCCKTPVLKACCSDGSESPNPGAPAQSRAQVNPNLTVTPAVAALDLPSLVRVVSAEQSAPRAGPIDLPTLLSTLLL